MGVEIVTGIADCRSCVGTTAVAFLILEPATASNGVPMPPSSSSSSPAPAPPPPPPVLVLSLIHI